MKASLTLVGCWVNFLFEISWLSLSWKKIIVVDVCDVCVSETHLGWGRLKLTVGHCVITQVALGVRQ